MGHDDRVDELHQTVCTVCDKRYTIVAIHAETVEVQCDCGVQEINLVPENELDEEMIHY